jgi:lipoprotein-releasing system permease protein
VSAKRWQALGLVLAGGGLFVMGLALAQSGVLPLALGDLGLVALGFGPLLEVLASLGGLLRHQQMVDAFRGSLDAPPASPATALFLLGLGAWVGGWASVARGLRPGTAAATAGSGSPAVGKPLHAKLLRSTDFYWGTLASYGFGILLAEVGFIVVYLMLVSRSSGRVPEADEVKSGLSPVWSFVGAFGTSLALAFAGGALGASNSKRLSTPEATIALLYFGLPVPLVLSLMHSDVSLMRSLGRSLGEIVFLATQLGEARPEMGYWLIYAALAVAFFIGVNFGFVATSSGRFDLRASYENFIANRHVSVFRPRLLLGALAVLILGIVPPLIVYAFVSAAETAVERTRIRKLGLKDPLAAAEALHQSKLRAQTPTAMMTALSVGGVGVGVMALIIVLSVMSGFEADLQAKILGTNAHGVVLKYSPEMEDYQDVLAKVDSVKGIAGATPFILNEVMISSGANISGSMIKGIDPDTVGSVTGLKEYMQSGGSLEGLTDPKKIRIPRLAPSMDAPAFDNRPPTGLPPTKKGKTPLDDDPLIDLPKEVDDESSAVLPGIVIGRELAANLKVVTGDRINVVSPVGGELGPQGPMPKLRPFRVAGIFYSGMFEYDSKFVYVHLREAQSFFGVKGASGIEVKVDSVDDARSILKRVGEKLGGYPYRTRDWGDMNRNLFAALRLEKLVMGLILSIIVIVAAGLIVATVIMLVLEKRKEIAVLKALGVSDGGVVKIFLTEGLQIGIAGGLLGLVSGLAWCFFIERVGIRLDPQIYYIPALPVRVEPFQTLLAVVIAVLVTFLASVYPALKASQVEPVDGLKAE